MAAFSDDELSAVHRFLVGFSGAMESAERAHRDG
jgi:hypothetical protein